MDLEGTGFVQFRSTDWDQYEASQTGSGWAPSSKALLLFQIRFYNDRPYLDLGLSTANQDKPGNAGIREIIFNAVRQNPGVFKPTRSSLTDGWMILHEEPKCILEPADYGPGWDDGTARRKVEDWIDKFVVEQFPEMNRIIVDCLRRHQESVRNNGQ